MPCGIGLAPREARRSGRRRVVAGNFFSTEPLFLIPPAQISGLTEAQGIGAPREQACALCSRSPFLILFNSLKTLGRTGAFSRSAFASSSLHGDSGILAVRKTDASVFRVLPPTS